MHLEKRVLITGGAGLLGPHLGERPLTKVRSFVCRQVDGE
jgi:hypothetical protein